MMIDDDLPRRGPRGELEPCEFPDEDEHDDEAVDTVPCPECGHEVFDEAIACPYCGYYLTSDTRVFSGKPWWWILLGVIGVVAVILALTWGNL